METRETERTSERRRRKGDRENLARGDRAIGRDKWEGLWNRRSEKGEINERNKSK